MTRRQQPARHYPRTARINEVVRETIAEELERLSDPRLGFVTLTDVDVKRDLRIADVYYSVLGSEEERIESANALRSATPHLRAVVGREVRMKYSPELRFKEDPGVAQGLRIEEALRSIRDGSRPSDDEELR